MIRNKRKLDDVSLSIFLSTCVPQAIYTYIKLSNQKPPMEMLQNY